MKPSICSPCYVEVEIGAEMIAAATAKLARMRRRLSVQAHRFGAELDRTLDGHVGEQAVLWYLKVNDVDSPDYDFVYRDKRFDVKTVRCGFRPPLHYMCTVNSCDLEGVYRQAADFYVFVRLLYDRSIAWLLGLISCDEFFRRGVYIKKGTKAFREQVFRKANATVLPIRELVPITRIDEVCSSVQWDS